MERKMVSTRFRKRFQEKGQGMVEFALTFPIFLMLVYGIFEVGRMIFMYSAVLNASRDAARYAAAADAVMANDTSYTEYYIDCEGIRARAENVSAIVDSSAGDSILISYDSGPGTEPIAESCEALRTSGTALELGDRIIVTVSTTFHPVVPLLNFNDIPISSTTERSLVTGMNIWEP
ncbi:MAG: pilus assembly protein [Anaerolineaceae bacterium]|nr:pilus assembly protein [Anaerolineaceae bacterium]